MDQDLFLQIMYVHLYFIYILSILFILNIISLKRGVVSIWSCKSNGALNLMYTFKLKYGCSHITLYYDDNQQQKEQHEQHEQHDDDMMMVSSFYISNNEGKIYLITDEGQCNDILDVEKYSNDDNDEIHFRLLKYIQIHKKLIFITEDMTLYIYDIINNNENELSLNKSFKLSISSNNNNINIICLHLFNGLIAISNEESLIRLFDIIHNDNYILSLTDSRHMAAPNDTIDQIKYIPSTKILIK